MKAKATDLTRQRTITISEPSKEKDPRSITPNSVNSKESPPLGVTSTVETSGPRNSGTQKKRRRRGTMRSTHRPFHADDVDMLLDKHDAEELLKLVQGHLVVWPYDWLCEADEKGQFVYAVDQLAPLEI